MLLIPVIACISSAVFNAFRFSFVKDLHVHAISKSAINFWYRLLSLPLIIVAFWSSRETLIGLDNLFYIWLVIALIVNIGYGYVQVWFYQKYPFSIAEGTSFLEVVFTFLLGFIIFSEKIAPTQGIGLLIIVISTFMLFHGYFRSINFVNIYGLIIFNLYTAFKNHRVYPKFRMILKCLDIRF